MLSIIHIAYLLVVLAFVWSLFNGSPSSSKIILLLCVICGGAITFSATEYVNSPAYQEAN